LKIPILPNFFRFSAQKRNSENINALENIIIYYKLL